MTLCACGCGQPTLPAKWSNPGRGHVKGVPLTYIHGHNASREKKVRYRVEDRGYVTPCWTWLLFVDPNGYGRLPGRMAHRTMYESEHGPVPTGLDLDHLCRNRDCVNPDHLEAVTRRENLLRGETIPAMNAAKTHCIHGHEFTPDNTKINRDGTRRCRTCAREQAAARYALRTAA